MPFDKNAFMSDILAGATVDPAQKAAIEALLDNPVIQRNTEGLTLRQSEFSKKMDDYNKKVQAAQDYWDGLVKWDKEAKAELQKDKLLLRQKLADEGVSLDNLDPAAPAGGSVSKEDFQKFAQEALAYANATSALGLKHFKEFGEVLDMQKVIDVATKEGTNINIAYDRLVQPRREEVQKTDFEKQLAAAREEGKLEAQKNLAIPAGDVPYANAGPHALDGLNRKPDGPQYGAMAAVNAWNEARKSGTQPLF